MCLLFWFLQIFKFWIACITHWCQWVDMMVQRAQIQTKKKTRQKRRNSIVSFFKLHFLFLGILPFFNCVFLFVCVWAPWVTVGVISFCSILDSSLSIIDIHHKICIVMCMHVFLKKHYKKIPIWKAPFSPNHNCFCYNFRQARAPLLNFHIATVW